MENIEEYQKHSAKCIDFQSLIESLKEKGELKDNIHFCQFCGEKIIPFHDFIYRKDVFGLPMAQVNEAWSFERIVDNFVNMNQRAQKRKGIFFKLFIIELKMINSIVEIPKNQLIELLNLSHCKVRHTQLSAIFRIRNYNLKFHSLESEDSLSISLENIDTNNLVVKSTIYLETA